MSEFRDLLEHDAHGGAVQRFLDPISAPRKPCIVRAEGVYLWDRAGKRYFDGSSGPVVNNLGHANPRVLRAMAEQAARVAYAYPTMFENEPNIELATLISSLSGPGLERVFFVSGGSEATESAIKLARQYAVASGQSERAIVIGRDPSYHGATLGALSVTGDEGVEELFGPLLRAMPKVPAPFSYRVPPNHTVETYSQVCADALESEILRHGPERVLAFIMEPVGGLATGALVAPDIYYAAVRAICDRYGVLLIFDEVMSGAGRTGRFLAADHWPTCRPDIVTLAKGIAAGYTPFGAVVASDALVTAVAESGGFMNGFTYFTNPLSCAVGVAVVRELLERDLIGNAARMGSYLQQQLLALKDHFSILGDIRGCGLLLAIELVADQDSRRMLPNGLNAPKRLTTLALEEGLALYGRRTSRGKYGDWVMVSPPLIITEAEVDELVALIARTLERFERDLRQEGDL